MAARYENQVEDTRHIVAVKQTLVGMLLELFAYGTIPDDIVQTINQLMTDEDYLELDVGDEISISKKAVELFEQLNNEQPETA